MEFNATFIVAFVSFIVFTVVMNLILYKPLSRVVDRRQDFVEDHYNEAIAHKEKAQAILTEKSEKIDKSKAEAKGIIHEKTELAKAKKTSLTAKAQQSAIKSIDDAKKDLQDSKDLAQDVLSKDVVGLAQNISSKILGESFDISDVDNQLVSKMIQEG